ncbi:N-acetylmannosamine-6-phosphate 2-epimerase [Deinococcus yavapaiensis]|uniref:Putative N-acetylmannosamine-6-phosphate 2-epimerase n=1 Tax=Deinococcus yavapaiensis KR-236 TaxID=694435 RepID=A0A318SAH2_9DEIO|nr:putative N-acetylmannosamine-6-phosphate 2-epimerase [Deinococcus yavapaiensis]PYE55398.1 N-acylglucosamine-6-phosphate 2-epimerase [Deinococcus yavapaiensis KR-236]
MTVAHILESLRGGLVASCQPVRGGPLDQPAHVAALALATLAGGAVALRLEGLPDLKATRPLTSAPIVGLVKRDEPGTNVYITPLLSDVRDLALAGADIIAFDATIRERPVPVERLVAAVHEHGKLVMADCSTFEEGLAAWKAGADFVGSTLSGYTPHSPALDGPDLDLVRALGKAGVRVIAEGRLHTPEDARAALHAGAYAVTVGSALTRLELMTKRFVDVLRDAPVEA